MIKKLIYFIPLFLLLLLPNNIHAYEVFNMYDYYYNLCPDNLTVTCEFPDIDVINILKNDSTFQERLKQYPYYIAIYNNGYNVFNGNTYPWRIYIFTFNEPNLKFTNYYDDITSPSFLQSALTFNLTTYNNNLIMIKENGVIENYNYSGSEYLTFRLGLLDSYNSSLEGNTYFYKFYLRSVITTNMTLTFPYDINFYSDSEFTNLIKTFPAGSNILADYNPPVSDEHNLAEITNADDTIYSISKSLLGKMPEEFEFLYSIVAILLALSLIFVVLSPIIIVIKLLGGNL